MLEATFTFTTSDPDAVLLPVSQMSGVRAVITGTDPCTMDVIVSSPFDEGRLDNVENVIRGLAADVVRTDVGI